MISSNGLIIIEMVSSETVDRGTVLFILKGGICLNCICHDIFGGKYMVNRLYVFRGRCQVISPPKYFMYYRIELTVTA